MEQYEGEVSIRQGPWTDVYALCAVLYSVVVGRAPGSSIARVVRDDLVPAREAARGRFSYPFLAAINAGLAVRPEQRPPSMAALRQLFDMPAVVVTAPVPAAGAPAAAAAAAPDASAPAAQPRAAMFGMLAVRRRWA